MVINGGMGLGMGVDEWLGVGGGVDVDSGRVTRGVDGWSGLEMGVNEWFEL